MIAQADKTKDTNWWVYILECQDGSLYTGIAVDLEKRLEQHNLGKGAKYTRCRLPVRLVYQEPAANRSEASRREYQIKQLNRAQKQTLVAS